LAKNAQVLVMYSSDAPRCPARLRDSGSSLSSWQTTPQCYRWTGHRVFPHTPGSLLDVSDSFTLILHFLRLSVHIQMYFKMVVVGLNWKRGDLDWI